MDQEGEDVNPLYAGGKKRRLVTTGLNGSVIEWDLTGKIRTKLTSQTAIWASQKFNTEANQKLIALATEDGSIKIVKVKKEAIQLQRTLPKVVGERCLSIAISSDDQHIYAGYSDGSLRKWELESGNCIMQMSKQRKEKSKKEILIWTLRLFNDQILFSGDSNGHVTVWDAFHGT